MKKKNQSSQKRTLVLRSKPLPLCPIGNSYGHGSLLLFNAHAKLWPCYAVIDFYFDLFNLSPTVL
ncbi:hypothetical protein HMPREF9193_01163 [Treponema lecithinolyticum ATCC 700332]|uniref:Uncharacterized protein n=1 Tax=Treponema lecithinolyticum ATCC 700332 TaxID=1321815 RepID=A0ABN0NYW2_TRELE|nr:hypothetical protein HMPREF9193_01163 [Treponema lecithinolyticum ATCC 700332]